MSDSGDIPYLTEREKILLAGLRLSSSGLHKLLTMKDEYNKPNHGKYGYA
jgi:hypothetical protein